MSTVNIDLGERSYEINISPGLLKSPQYFDRDTIGNQVFVITNEIVAPLYLDNLRQSLADREIHEMVLPDGEYTKNLDNFGILLDRMLSVPCDRGVTVVALGGGVIGDLAGFVASSYQRGVGFVQVPTTLLSQVDSSVGGKTGVNHALGKNMIGAFYQPRRVIIDTDTLWTLPARQFSSGLAEVIKYGLINDYDFFCWLEQHLDSVMALDPAAIETVVTQSCANKAKIVQRDEREGGVRALLNLGHTFGHAIETATGYNSWLHGEAVAVGMVMAAHLSLAMGRLDDADLERITTLLKRANLPYAPFRGISAGQLRSLMQGDKKVLGGRLRMILLRSIGEADIVDNPEEKLLNATLEAFTG